MARDREGLDDVLHDLRNVLGLVHVAAADARQAHADGEDVGERLAELEALAKLATDVLRAMGSGGRQMRPFDLRAAAVCARSEERSIAVGELLVPVVADAPAGDLIDLVLAITRALSSGEGSRVDVTQGDDGALRFVPGVPSRESTRAAASASKDRAAALGVTLSAEDGAVVLRAPKRAAGPK